MSKTKAPIFVILLLSFGVLVCSAPSLLSYVLIAPAIAFFSALCILAPSPFLVFLPVISVAISFFAASSGGDYSSAIFSSAVSLFYVLPSALIAISYFKKQSKMQAVMNGTVGLFLYCTVIIVIGFILSYGTFNRELLNSLIDNQIAEITRTASETFSDFRYSEQAIDLDVFEQSLRMSKPLLPASIAALTFTFSYIAVCILNFILKLTKMIENTSYRLVPHWICGIAFLISLIAGIFVEPESFVAVLFSSVTLLLTPLFFIVGFGVVYDALSKTLKHKLVSLVIIFVFLLASNLIIYNLFYLVGCYYSIITGIKKNERFNFKGGQQ